MSFAGFDTDAFPGLPAMALLKARTNLSWCVTYLVAPSHANAGWMGQREALEAQGWGLLPVFVGQQLAGPGSHLVRGPQGALDGLRAGRAMVAEGYLPRSVVVLDLEDGAPFVPPRSQYVDEWANAVEASGYQPGVYCSHGIAHAVAAANPGVLIFAFKVPTIAHTHAATPFETPDVDGCGFAGALAWQHRQNVTIQVDGRSLLVDLDVAITPRPGSPRP